MMEINYKAVDKNGRELKIGDYVKWKGWEKCTPCYKCGSIDSIFIDNGIEINEKNHLPGRYDYHARSSTAVEFVISDDDLNLILKAKVDESSHIC